MQISRILAFLCVFFLPVHGIAQETLVQDSTTASSEIKITSLLSQLPPHGYLPVRVEINNSLSKSATNWNLKVTSENTAYFREGSSIDSRFSCPCPAGETRTYDIQVPLVKHFQSVSGYSSYGPSLDIEAIDSEGKKVHGYMSSSSGTEGNIIGMSNALARANESRISFSSGYGSSSSEVNSFSPQMLPSDWRGYSGLQALYIKESEWETLSGDVKNAILQWNRTGGELRIATSSSNSLSSMGVNVDSGSSRSFGTAKLVKTESSDQLPASELSHIQGLSGSTSSQLELYDYSFARSWGLHKLLPEKNSSAFFFILILLAFGVLVGPVNVFVFARKGRRHKLFFTTPVISLIACALLVLLIVIQDGSGGKGVRCTIMEVRSGEENTAYIEQEQIARTGVMFGSEFNLPPSTTITPVATPNNRWARVTTTNEGGSNKYSLNNEDKSLVAGGDWFLSRSEIGHHLSSVQPNRGNLIFGAAGSSPTVNSNFDFPVSKVLYCDADGKWWKSGELNSGESSQMHYINAIEVSAWINEQSKDLSEYMKTKLKHITSRKSSYIAITTEGPNIETLDSIDWDSRTIITGSVN